MNSRAVQPRTADLFAAVEAPGPAAAPAGAGARSAGGGVPPTLGACSAERPAQLWYAVVFPGLRAGADAHGAQLRRLARRAQRFTSRVSLEAPNALLLEIQGSLRLFGSLAELHARIDAEWHALGLAVAGATAPAAVAALWFARAGHPALIENPGELAGRLASMPLECTGWDREHLRLLHAMGVRRLGELLRLPRAGLARRLGPAAVLDLDRALARQPAPRRAFVPCLRFRERRDFDTEVEHLAYLQQALEPLLERCARFLRRRQAGVQWLELSLRHRALSATRLRAGFAGVTGESRRLREVLYERLAALTLAGAVRGVELVSGPLQPLPGVSLDVFAGARAGAGGCDTAPQLVERLRARLGEGAVYGLRSIAEHRPEGAWRREHAFETLAPPVDGALEMPRPVWLLHEPLPLRAPRPQAAASGAMVLERGPERIESGWWDDRGVTRDYYVASRARGARLWIFQERRTRHWYLHGVFA